VDYRFSLAGLLVGSDRLTGMGGGSLLAPILILFFRVPPLWAVGNGHYLLDRDQRAGQHCPYSPTHNQFSGSFLAGLWSVPATLLSVLLVR